MKILKKKSSSLSAMRLAPYALRLTLCAVRCALCELSGGAYV
jgi:hypothetical protein